MEDEIWEVTNLQKLTLSDLSWFSAGSIKCQSHQEAVALAMPSSYSELPRSYGSWCPASVEFGGIRLVLSVFL